ncbi:hypothetical protein L1887_55725 [Cichorium endivia]|nr:hypothetical protein L1887_55725 [Cichorium endivia]
MNFTLDSWRWHEIASAARSSPQPPPHHRSRPRRNSETFKQFQDFPTDTAPPLPHATKRSCIWTPNHEPFGVEGRVRRCCAHSCCLVNQLIAASRLLARTAVPAMSAIRCNGRHSRLVASTPADLRAVPRACIVLGLEACRPLSSGTLYRNGSVLPVSTSKVRKGRKSGYLLDLSISFSCGCAFEKGTQSSLGRRAELPKRTARHTRAFLTHTQCSETRTLGLLIRALASSSTQPQALFNPPTSSGSLKHAGSSYRLLCSSSRFLHFDPRPTTHASPALRRYSHIEACLDIALAVSIPRKPTHAPSPAL